MDDIRFRTRIREALRSISLKTEEALRRELSKPIDLGHSGYLQFECDGQDYGIWLIQTEEVVVGESVWDLLPKSFFNETESAGIDLFEMIEEELVEWFADRWSIVDGPDFYSPAYLFFHGGLYTPRFDLEQRRWCTVEEVWPGE